MDANASQLDNSIRIGQLPIADLSSSVPPSSSLKIIIKALRTSIFLGTMVGHLSQCPANKNASSLLLVPHFFYKQEIKLPSLGPSSLNSSYTSTGAQVFPAPKGSEEERRRSVSLIPEIPSVEPLKI